jgi:hypothetical protein
LEVVLLCAGVGGYEDRPLDFFRKPYGLRKSARCCNGDIANFLIIYLMIMKYSIGEQNIARCDIFFLFSCNIFKFFVVSLKENKSSAVQ